MPFFPIAQLSAFYLGEIHKRFGGGCRGKLTSYKLSKITDYRLSLSVDRTVAIVVIQTLSSLNNIHHIVAKLLAL